LRSLIYACGPKVLLAIRWAMPSFASELERMTSSACHTAGDHRQDSGGADLQRGVAAAGSDGQCRRGDRRVGAAVLLLVSASRQIKLSSLIDLAPGARRGTARALALSL
jgi:hypothetical protein